MKSFSNTLILSVVLLFSVGSVSAHVLSTGCVMRPEQMSQFCSMNQAREAHPKISQKNEQFVRELFVQLGINEKVTRIIRIRDINAAVGHMPGQGDNEYTMLLGEAWFDGMSLREKFALIGHESHHIICGHCENHLFPGDPEDMAISRAQEKEADMKSCKFFNCFDGGLMLFLNLYSSHGDYPESPFNSHPTLKTRMTYLLEGLKEYQKMLPQALVQYLQNRPVQLLTPDLVIAQ